MKRTLAIAAMALFVLAGVSRADGPAASPKAAPDSTVSALPLATPLPFVAPLTPLPSGALTNIDAAETNWRTIQQKLLFGESTPPDRPWILLERARFGDVNSWNEYYMHDWERTPEYILQRQINRSSLGPDGKPIRKP